MKPRVFALFLALGLLAACGPFTPAAPTPPPALPTQAPLLTTAPTSPVATASPAPATVVTPPTVPVDTATAVPSEALTATAPAPTAATPAIAEQAAPTATTEGTAPTTAEGTATPDGTAAASPSASAVPEATIAPATAAQLRKIESEMVQLRGLQPKVQVPAHFVSDAQIAANLKAQIAHGYSPAEARRDTLELWLLRLIDDRSLDLYQLQIDLLGEQVLGYYDTDKKELFVRSDQQPLGVLAEETLAHEFVHSLQDEYYNLNKMQPPHSHNGDRDTAVTSLVEGDAVLSQTLFDTRDLSPAEFAALMQAHANPPTSRLDQAPAYIRDSLDFPYTAGAQFVATLYRQGGFAAVNRALADPPDSSEQILHPAKYMNAPRDEPLPVPVPALTGTLGAGWTLQDTNTLGEFDLAEMLQVNNINQPDAATGWGGARYALYQGNGAAVIVLATRWDTASNAATFDSALRASLVGADQSGGLWSQGGRVLGLIHATDRETFVAGTDRATVTRVLAALK